MILVKTVRLPPFYCLCIFFSVDTDCNASAPIMNSSLRLSCFWIGRLPSRLLFVVFLRYHRACCGVSSKIWCLCRCMHWPTSIFCFRTCFISRTYSIVIGQHWERYPLMSWKHSNCHKSLWNFSRDRHGKVQPSWRAARRSFEPAVAWSIGWLCPLRTLAALLQGWAAQSRIRRWSVWAAGEVHPSHYMNVNSYRCWVVFEIPCSI